MRLGLQHFIAGSAAFAASVYSGYWYAKPAKLLPQGPADEQTDGCAFDRLATVYDSIIGSEERYMFYGLLRSWLLRKAQGDVLEISAGTGRNLPHYSFSRLHSLTMTDISQPMLQQAQNKYFDLQLQYKQPDVNVKFLLADAEHMVAVAGQEATTVGLPSRRGGLPTVHAPSRQGSDSSINNTNTNDTSIRDSSSRVSSTEGPKSVWRYKTQQQQQQQHSDMSMLQEAPESSSCGSMIADQQQSLPSSSSSISTEGRRSDTSSSSSSSSRPWWRKIPQTCDCRHASSSSNSTGSDNSSSKDGSSSKGGSKFSPGSFDVVVDTFGLCSCEDPVQVLQQAALLLRPGGKLLLLEHGRSTWRWLNDHMDTAAARHHKVYGCWYNRDILDIVQKAGLQIESSSRWHFGTSYMIVATPAATPAAAAAADAAAAAA